MDLQPEFAEPLKWLEVDLGDELAKLGPNLLPLHILKRLVEALRQLAVSLRRRAVEADDAGRLDTGQLGVKVRLASLVVVRERLQVGDLHDAVQAHLLRPRELALDLGELTFHRGAARQNVPTFGFSCLTVLPDGVGNRCGRQELGPDAVNHSPLDRQRSEA